MTAIYYEGMDASEIEAFENALRKDHRQSSRGWMEAR